MERFKLHNLTGNKTAHLLIRTAPETASNVFVRVGGTPIVQLSFEKGVSWVEAVAAIPGEIVGETVDVELWNQGPADFVDYHVWVTQ